MQLVFHDALHEAHNPKMCFRRGVALQSREVAERATILKAALLETGHDSKRSTMHARASRRSDLMRS